MSTLMMETLLHDLDAVSLGDLVEQAALLVRVDRKYVLSRADAEMLVATLPRATRALEIDGGRRFGYSSLYYDTVGLDAFRQTAQRRRRRFKVRTRAYETGGSFLEVKTRLGARTVKERVPWGLPADEQLDLAGLTFVLDRLGSAGLGDPDLLVPALWTRYRRSTLLLPEGARLTIDGDLTWEDARSGAFLARPDLTVVETKSGSSPSSADRALWSLGHRPTAISKYATGLAALHPDLPRNRWARLLHRSFR